MRRVPGILILHRSLIAPNAACVAESIDAFHRYSSFPAVDVNVGFGFPPSLRNHEFDALVLHYSLFGDWPFELRGEYPDYLDSCQSSYKIAFFQDEHRNCPQRFEFLNKHRIPCVYTLLEPPFHNVVYGTHTRAESIKFYLPSYIEADMLRWAARAAKPDAERTVDLGYRARKLAFYMGRGSQEKHLIADYFLGRPEVGLRLDISTDESSRLYGAAYYNWLANCKACLGVESGVSVFDLDGTARRECDAYLAAHPEAKFEEVEQAVLHRFEDKIFYRTITGRHFESAAFRVCQVLFEGHYSGMMTPGTEYISLRKDFSNVDQVLRDLRNSALRSEICRAAHARLIEAENCTYKQFTGDFDQGLKDLGLAPHPAEATAVRRLQCVFRREVRRNRLKAYYDFYARKIFNYQFWGRSRLRRLGAPLRRVLGILE